MKAISIFNESLAAAGAVKARLGAQTRLMNEAARRRGETLAEDLGSRSRRRGSEAHSLWHAFGGLDGRALAAQWLAYWQDSLQRGLLFADALRARGNDDDAHEAAGTPPLLAYDHETVIDGRDLPRPTNYRLLRILPPADLATDDRLRPYLIIDPRAGHGAGIGGFKDDSQVGVALRGGHVVYFVAFGPHPEPGQTIADVMRAEAAFVREVSRRHPQAPKPIVVGNCQGGWATMLMAAVNPDITGPLVINGAPVAYWSGRVGENPMRYRGGLSGGIVPALLLADLGGGEFDGAYLVANFENLNPSRNHFGKYYDLYRDVDRGRERFLEFERWWGGIHFMARDEIRWILEQLFVGNRLSRGAAQIEPGCTVDLKQIRSPIIVFCSRGDNITPPQQALNWIVDTYADEQEMTVRGQRIVYAIHDKVGHLGIFVSGAVAKREYTQFEETLKIIEALPPGLYEMRIDETPKADGTPQVSVSFHERRLADLASLDDRRDDEAPFAAVNRLSELTSEFYELQLRPVVKAVATPRTAAALRDAHPMRMQRRFWSDRNPWMRPVAGWAARARDERRAVASDNVFVRAEALWAERVLQAMDLGRDLRDAFEELSFLGVYASPAMRALGERDAWQRRQPTPVELRLQPEVQALLQRLDQGELPEAVVRMLLVLATTRGTVRRTRLARSAKMLNDTEPFRSLGSEARARLIHEQAVIVEFEREAAIRALPRLLQTPAIRAQAMAKVEHVVGDPSERGAVTLEVLARFRAVLGLEIVPTGAPGAGPAQAPNADPAQVPGIER